MSIVVTVLGGSAPSTPALADWLAHACPETPFTLRLAGRTPHKLDFVARACELLSAGSALRVERFPLEHWGAALSGADVVLVQIRAGGLAARESDETIPPAFDVPGDEGLGPGGLAAALRTWPVLQEIFRLIRRHAPASRVLLLTSPAGLLVSAAAREFPELGVAALCELPFTTLAQVAGLLHRKVAEIPFSYCGVNHLGWLYDATGELAEAYASQNASPLAAVARRFGAVPLRYWHLHFERARIAGEQRRAGPENCRARQLMLIAEHSFAVFQDGDAAQMREALARRPAPWYSEAVGPLLRSFAGATDSRPFFITTGSEERAVRYHNGQLEQMPAGEPPPPLRELVDAFVQYEQVALTAMLHPTQETIEEALAAHPWLQTRQQAGALAAAILTTAEARSAALV